jgi:hypothetical protein
MTTELAVLTDYIGSSYTSIELPDNKTWDDVESHYIKWHTLRILFKGDTEYVEFPLNDEIELDQKRPANFAIRSYTSDNVSIDWDEEPLSQGEN